MGQKLIISVEKCKGCGLCIEACPKRILVRSASITKEGYYPAVVAYEDKCNYCGLCFITCPDLAISAV